MTDEGSQQIIINERELEVLIITSIHTLDVYNLVRESLDYEISKDDYHKTLNSSIESKLVVVNTRKNQECLSMPKDFPMSGNENEYEENHTNEDFNNFKENFLEEFNDFKRSFFNEVKTFKEDILKMHKTTPKITDNQEQQMITLLHNDVIFLKQQLQQKDKFIDSLIKQLSVQNEFILQQKCSVIQKETYKQQPLQNETENRTENSCEKSITPSKSSSIERSVISPNTTITELFVQEEAENRDSADNEKIDEREGIVHHEKETDSGKNSAQDPANKSKSSRKSVVILGDSMTKSLNGYEMAKKTNTNCKIYVKSFSGATTADMEDYMKPSVRKSPDHFILHVGTNDLSANKSPLQTANEIINLACK